MSHIFDPSHAPLLLVVGLGILGGALGARVFQLLRIPQVVGYIVIGIVIGKSGLGIVDGAQIDKLVPVTFFALGVIGFLIGSELNLGVFRKYGKQFFVILFAEGMGAFALVSLLTGAVTYALTRDAATAVALGVVLGAISSATAPAATVDVLWEYKTLGPITTTVLAIVALDDALALFLYSIMSSVAMRLLGGGDMSAWSGALRTVYELGGAVALGAAAGMLLNFLLRRIREHEKSLTVIVGVLALLIGVAILLKVDMILAAMALGMLLANLAPRRSHNARKIIERFAQPIFVIFFVIVGARLSVHGMSYWLWILAAAFVVGRTAGKMSGAWLGARVSRAVESVQKYLGLCLFSQAGVAIGLAILAGARFADYTVGGASMGDIIVAVVTATTFLVQIIGPPCVKMAVTRAGEVGRNVTEEDLINSYGVENVFNPSAPAFAEDIPVTRIVGSLAETDFSSCVVTDHAGQVIGIITLDDIKAFFADSGMGQWLVAFDIMRAAPDAVTGDMPLADALGLMRQQGLESLPVTDAQGRYLGLLELKEINRTISHEVLRRRQAVRA